LFLLNKPKQELAWSPGWGIAWIASADTRACCPGARVALACSKTLEDGIRGYCSPRHHAEPQFKQQSAGCFGAMGCPPARVLAADRPSHPCPLPAPQRLEAPPSDTASPLAPAPQAMAVPSPAGSCSHQSDVGGPVGAVGPGGRQEGGKGAGAAGGGIACGPRGAEPGLVSACNCQPCLLCIPILSVVGRMFVLVRPAKHCPRRAHAGFPRSSMQQRAAAGAACCMGPLPEFCPVVTHAGQSSAAGGAGGCRPAAAPPAAHGPGKESGAQPGWRHTAQPAARATACGAGGYSPGHCHARQPQCCEP
jgi:hypothetical protein